MEVDLDLALAKSIEAGVISKLDEIDPVFRSIENVFPTNGTRIRWELVSSWREVEVVSHGGQIHAHDVEALLRAQTDLVQAWFASVSVSETEVLTWVGDMSGHGYTMAAKDLLRLFPVLCAMPQHSYVLPASRAWCLNYLIEGRLMFGKAQPKARGGECMGRASA